MLSLLVPSLAFYGFLVLVGGAIGYVKAKSRASLVAGFAFATLLGIATFLVVTGSPRAGAGLGIVSAVSLIARFLPAFLRTKKVMPAGAVVTLGAWVLLVCTLALAH